MIVCVTSMFFMMMPQELVLSQEDQVVVLADEGPVVYDFVYVDEYGMGVYCVQGMIPTTQESEDA
jgi:hypothetical protein